MNFNFRPLETEDLPQLHTWLTTAFVMEWFCKKPTTLDEVKRKYARYITGEKPTRAYIIQADNIDIGYIQTYLILDYPDYNKYVQADTHSAGVDLFIGHPDFIHRGFGADILREFLKLYVFSDPHVESCIIGPEPKNRTAIRMYEKAGFRWYKTVQLPDEDEPEYLMMFNARC